MRGDGGQLLTKVQVSYLASISQRNRFVCLLLSCATACRKRARRGEVEVCSVKKGGGGGGKAARASNGRRSSGGAKQPSIADMFSRE